MSLDTETLTAALTHAVPIPASPGPFLYFAPAGVASLAAVQYPKKQRLALVPLIAGSLYGGLLAAPASFHGFAWSYNYGLFMVIYLLFTMHKLFVDPQVPAAPKAASLTSPASWLRAYKVITERQLPGAGPNVSRGAFALHRLASIGAIGLMLTASGLFVFPGPFDPFTESDFDPARYGILRRLLFPATTSTPVTARELWMRLAFVAGAGTEVSLQLMQSHNVLALLFVCIFRVDAPRDWPSFFGPLAAITSLRAFWGRFWHRIIVRTYAGLAGFVSQHLVGLAPRGASDRVLVHMLVFSISGAVHAAVSWAFGQQCGLWRDWAWYAGTYPAIVLEDGIVASAVWVFTILLNTVGVKKGSAAHVQTLQRVKVATGLTCMFAWFLWSTPKLYYPKAICLPEAFS